MKLKSALIGTALTLASLPIIANANLITTNNTPEYSSVWVTSVSPNRCSGMAHDDVGITKPGQTQTTSTADVKDLCGKPLPCKANILMAKDYNSAKNCSGTVIGNAQIDDLNTDIVTHLYIDPKTKYSGSGQGSNHITLDKAQ